MIRTTIQARPNWQKRLSDIGFTFYDLPSEGGRPYWNETAAYQLNVKEVSTLETVTKELFDRCLDAVDHIVTNKKFADYAIPEAYWQPIIESWQRDDPTVYGRFVVC